LHYLPPVGFIPITLHLVLSGHHNVKKVPQGISRHDMPHGRRPVRAYCPMNAPLFESAEYLLDMRLHFKIDYEIPEIDVVLKELDPFLFGGSIVAEYMGD
jgi:hypothetical protein